MRGLFLGYKPYVLSNGGAYRSDFHCACAQKPIKHYLLYGLLAGGLGDIIIVAVLTMLNFIQYKGMGVFGVFGMFSVWGPLTIAFSFAIFLYLLPTRRIFLVPYIFLFALANYSLGIVFENMGLFEYIGIWRYIAPFAFFSWYSITALIYFKDNDIKLEGGWLRVGVSSPGQLRLHALAKPFPENDKEKGKE